MKLGTFVYFGFDYIPLGKLMRWQTHYQTLLLQSTIPKSQVSPNLQIHRDKNEHTALRRK